MSAGSMHLVRPPGGLLIAIAAINSFGCILAAAFFFAAFTTLGLHPCTLVGFGVTAFPAAVVLFDAYRSLAYRDYQASERLSRLAFVFAGIIALISFFVLMFTLGAIFRREISPTLSEAFVPFFLVSSPAAYLLFTGLLFHAWSKNIQADLMSMDVETRLAHLAALEARRWSIRELLLVVTVLSVVLGFATSIRKTMFPQANWGAVPAIEKRLA